MKYIIIALVILLSTCTFSKDKKNDNPLKPDEEYNPHPQYTIGLGIGLDHGGFGGRLTGYLTRDFGVFAGGGSNLNFFQYAVGAEFRFSGKTQKKYTPYLSAWYGTNATITFEDANGALLFDKTYNGFSLAIGLRYMSDFSNLGSWQFGLIFPFRDPQVQKDIDMIESMGGEFPVGLLPFGISIGYSITLSKF
jgi:hypothetical protein